MRHKKLSLLIAALFTTPMLAAQAQQDATANNDIQQVTVSGIRASVRNNATTSCACRSHSG